MDKLNEILERYKDIKGALIPVLQEVQNAVGYLPKEVLIAIAKGLKVPLSQVYGVVTFYAQFFLTPHGKYTIKICRGTACHVRGAKEIISSIENIIKLKEGETSADFKFTFETVACVGACALAPVIMINKEFFGKVCPEKVSDILGQYGD